MQSVRRDLVRVRWANPDLNDLEVGQLKACPQVVGVAEVQLDFDGAAAPGAGVPTPGKAITSSACWATSRHESPSSPGVSTGPNVNPSICPAPVSVANLRGVNLAVWSPARNSSHCSAW